ncbi:hypothetical protein [Pseudobacteroides cellulosolvens]|uniref:Uncharacterized protein n=1 Tax=Pseudobacteroides cellulosolvens ATCC 35603 = DSM 2933 TaxID=398512 RepID=A0A0L6JW22_9FIRM|nr:hypothetical protein [Pseudobacteroides cellulosolvens]KNY30066.1 hypothetical protein Bccel_5343 [Pseudobacteroides cellulosolvens ATCC 35603 = DSM 2933]
MGNTIKLNQALLLKRQKIMERSTPKCNEKDSPCFFRSPINKPTSELWIIDGLMLCPLNQSNRKLQDCINEILKGSFCYTDKVLLFTIQDAIYSAICLVEEEILQSIHNGLFHCSDIQKYMENLNMLTEKIATQYAEI